MARTKKIIPGKIIFREQIKSSSSKNIYTVTIYDNCISCTCPAGGKQMLCKHVIEIIHKNFEKLREQIPEFFAILIKFIEAKNNKSVDRNLLQQYAKEIIYLNKEITEKAHNNKENLNSTRKTPKKVANNADFKTCPKCGHICDKSFEECPNCNKTVDKEIFTGCLNGLIFIIALTFSLVKMSFIPLFLGIIICFIISYKHQERKNDEFC